MKDDWFEGSLFDESELDNSIAIEKEKKSYNTRKKEETDDNLFLPGLFDFEGDNTIKSLIAPCCWKCSPKYI